MKKFRDKQMTQANHFGLNSIYFGVLAIWVQLCSALRLPVVNSTYMLKTFDCNISQVHITLGDNFQNSQNKIVDHLFTIGLIAQGTCQNPETGPILSLLDSQGQIQLNLTQWMAKLIEVPVSEYTNYDKFRSLLSRKPKEYSSKIQNEIDPSTVVYSRTAFFYKISTRMVNDYSSWMVLWGDIPATISTPFPQLASVQDDSIVFAMAADLDLSAQGTVTVDAWNNFPTASYDMLMHVGDFAYDIQNNNGTLGDAFFDYMSRSTSRIPYIVSGGNHEDFMNGYMFDYRFRMANTPTTPSINTKTQQNNYYDFVYKGVYFVTLNFDYLFFYNPKGMAEALSWLENSLSTATANQAVLWKVFFTHRPIYCNDVVYAADCTVNMYYFKPVEDLLIKYGVHVVLNGHVHIYSRFYPFSNLNFSNTNDTTVAGIGEGKYLQIIAGHSGTSHFFPNESQVPNYELPFVANVNLMGSSYCIFNFSGTTLTFSLKDSASGETLDTLTVTIPANNKNDPWKLNPLILVLGVGGILLLILLIFLVFKYKIIYSQNTEISKPAGMVSSGLEHLKARQVDTRITVERRIQE
jgi:Calcineurin-like phosphoesterase